MMHVAGLERIRWTLIAGGIIAIHSGVKPGEAQQAEEAR